MILGREAVLWERLCLVIIVPGAPGCESRRAIRVAFKCRTGKVRDKSVPWNVAQVPNVQFIQARQKNVCLPQFCHKVFTSVVHHTYLTYNRPNSNSTHQQNGTTQLSSQVLLLHVVGIFDFAPLLRLMQHFQRARLLRMGYAEFVLSGCIVQTLPF